MKVLIVGAGAQGFVLTWHLARHPAVTEIVLGDWEEARAQAVAARNGASKARAVKVDARDKRAVADLAEGAELIVNAVLPEWDFPLMEAALMAHTHYQDMATRKPGGTGPQGFAMQLELDEQFKDIDRAALVHTGMDPGVTNTLAAIGYEDLDRCAEVRVKDFGVFRSEVPLQVWSQETYYIDSQTHAAYYEDKTFKTAEPFGGWEYYAFPEPYGVGPVVYHEHEEAFTLPIFLPKLGEKGLEYVDFKFGGPEEGLRADKAIVESGMASPVPVTLRDGTSVRPIDVLVALLPPNPEPNEIARLAREGKIEDHGVLVVDLHRHAGEPPGEQFVIYPPDIQWVTERLPGATCVSWGTSTPAAIYAEYLLEGRIARRGVFPCEGVPRDVRLEYVQELGRRGIRIVRRSERTL